MENLNKEKLEIFTARVLQSITGEGIPDDS